MILGVVGLLMVLPGTQYLRTVGVEFSLRDATDLLKAVLLRASASDTRLSAFNMMFLLGIVLFGYFDNRQTRRKARQIAELFEWLHTGNELRHFLFGFQH